MTLYPPRKIACLLLVLAIAAPAAAAGPTPEGVEFFEKKVRPLLVANCHQCHSTGKKQRGGLMLDSRAAVLKGGDNGPAVVPGEPDRSRLIKAIGYMDPDLRMPPRSKLSDEQIADLKKWVEMGVPWPNDTATTQGPTGKEVFDLQQRRKHWAWQPLKAAPPPAVRQRDWLRTPVDCFVLAKLEAAGLSPAPPADKRTLLRRVTYDLTGLPPTPAEIDAFLADEAPDAYEKVVERLLASPAYGERWARHWLDLVRYAETLGHEFDFDLPDAYRYRDYVIRAFNDDLPYDQFVTEHVAGDLLPSPRRHPKERFNESVLATGFWFLGEAKHSPVDVRGDQADRIDNQLDVFGKTFLGLTVACARCHDHKFDAISQKDYYALAGYVQSSRFQRAFIDDPEPTAAALRRLQELHGASRPLAVALSAKVLEERADDLAQFLVKGQTTRQDLAAHLRTVAPRPADRDARYTVFEDFSGDTYRDWFVTGEAFGSGPSRGSDVLTQADPGSPVRTVPGDGVAHSGLVANRLKGVLRSKTFVIEKNKVLYRVAGTEGQINLIIDGYQLIRDPIYGGLTFRVNHGDRLEWRAQDVSMWVGHRAYVEIIDDGPGFVVVDQVLFSDDGPPPDVPNPLLTRPLEASPSASPEELAGKYRDLFLEIVGQWRTGTLGSAAEAADRVALLNWMLSVARPAADAPVPEARRADLARLADLLKQEKQAEANLPEPRRALAMADGSLVKERVHLRGSHKNLGDEVPPRFLEAVAGEQPAPSEGSGRLELARSMVDPSDPLLPRVLVNRVWQHHFGEGIVRSVDNFGVLGQPPTHPELLDWLAAEFVRSGWSVKAMHRLMVLSSTYRMASNTSPSPPPLSPEGRGASNRPPSPLWGEGLGVRGDEADPQDLLLHRMPIRRLEAEAIRDAMLAASGQLDRRLYGPGVPPHLTPFMVGRGRPASSGPLDGDGRRSLYVNVRRNFLTPMFLAFDYPIPFTTIGRRSVSNVPAQALALMNNPFVVQQAEAWAKRALAEPGRVPPQRVTEMYLTAFGRPPTDAELAEALAFLEEQGKQYGRADDPRAWADLCHVLMNVKEFIFIN